MKADFNHPTSRRLAVLVLAMMGCGSDSPPSVAVIADARAPDSSPDAPLPRIDALVPDAPGFDAPVADAPGCQPGAGPTLHATISGDETWTAAQSPHVVTGDVQVSGTLTLAPCVEVRIAAQATVNVKATGRLVARGTELEPIHITASVPGRPFAALRAVAGGTITFTHVDLDGGGDPQGSPAFLAGLITLLGADPSTNVPALATDHVRITGSASNGILFQDGATFAPGSTNLTVTGAAAWPLSLVASAADLIPTGDYSGNGHDEILIASGSGAGAIHVDTTLRARGVPYRVGNDLTSGELSVDPPVGGSSVVTLTIEPGVILRFKRGGVMHIQHFIGDQPALAALVAEGTADQPIVFTSAAETPAPGDWLGISFGQVPAATNRMVHTRVEFAGGAGASGSSSCPTPFGLSADAAVRIFGKPANAFISQSAIVSSASHGIDRGWTSDAPVSFLATNTFEDVAWCDETFPTPVAGSCPAPAAVPCPRQ